MLSELTTLEQVAALKQGRIDIGFGRLLFNDDAVTRHVLLEEKLSVAVPEGHVLSRNRRSVKLKHTVDGPLILYPNAPRPSYADQVLSFYRKLGLEPKVGFEARELQTALGLVAAGVGIALVPSSVRRLGRNDVKYLVLDEAEVVSPIIVSFRSNDRSSLLARFLQPIPELDMRGNPKWPPSRSDQTTPGVSIRISRTTAPMGSAESIWVKRTGSAHTENCSMSASLREGPSCCAQRNVAKGYEQTFGA